MIRFGLPLALFPWSILAPAAPAAPPDTAPRVVAYVPNWIDLPVFSKTIDYGKVTHLNLAFENPVNDAGLLSFNPQDDALVKEATAHGVPVLVSIGGGAASGDRALLARYAGLLGDKARRAEFAAGLARYVAAHGFAGLDVDLEGPGINGDYDAFVADLATAFKPQGKLLTAALSKGYGGDKVPASALERFDFVNVMAYDGAGPWNPDAPGQHSSLEFAADNVRYWTGRGLPRDRAVLGVPFYGYGFGAAFRHRDYPYKDIVRQFPGAEAADQTGDTIWYNGRPTIRAKAAYAREQGLGGVMIWSLDYDVGGPASLLSTIHEALQPPSLPQRIRADQSLPDVLARARALLKGSLNAGSGYPEVWIRDLATFMEVACQVNDPAEIRRNLLLLLRFQGADGNIPDGVGHRDVPSGSTPDPSAAPAPLRVSERLDRLVIERPDVPDYVAFKNSVETDQESSLVLAVGTYLKATGDTALLREVVDGCPVLARLQDALGFLLRERFSEPYGLLWGGTTIDWGDIAPEDPIGAVLGPKSHRAIDVYDNALFLLAVDALLPMLGDDPAATARWQAAANGIRAHVRRHLWDATRGKFVPHLYLDGSPFPPEFDEAAMWYHGGTAVAIQAGLLGRDEVAATLAALRRNVREAGMLTVGLTNYPVYPKGCFLNGSADPFIYQNGGDWDWFGARMVQALLAGGFPEEAYEELRPLLARVQRHDGFYEWFDRQDRPQGSARFKGSAGELGSAILRLQEWAKSKDGGSTPSSLTR